MAAALQPRQAWVVEAAASRCSLFDTTPASSRTALPTAGRGSCAGGGRVHVGAVSIELIGRQVEVLRHPCGIGTEVPNQLNVVVDHQPALFLLRPGERQRQLGSLHRRRSYSDLVDWFTIIINC